MCRRQAQQAFQPRICKTIESTRPVDRHSFKNAVTREPEANRRFVCQANGLGDAGNEAVSRKPSPCVSGAPFAGQRERCIKDWGLRGKQHDKRQ